MIPKWFSIFVDTATEKDKCAVDGIMDYPHAIGLANAHYNMTGGRARVFVGKEVGKLIYDTDEWKGLTI